MRTRAIELVIALWIGWAATGCMEEVRHQRALELYVAGQLLADRGEIEAALKELAKALEHDPHLAVAHSAIGDIQRKQGHYRQAVDSYQAACTSDPYAFRPHYNLGVTYQILSEAAKLLEAANDYLQRAVQIYLRAAAIEPEDFDTNLNLGACYFQLGKLDLAEQYCKAAVAADPRRPEAFSNLGVVYDAQNRLHEAVHAYKSSLELDTNQPNLLLNLGGTYVRLNSVKQAIRTFRLAAETDPDRSAPWEAIGNCHYRLGDLDKALGAFQTALKINPASAPAHRGAGVIHMSRFVLNPARTELRDKALEAWHASLEHDPGQQDLLRLVRKYTPKPTGPEL